MRILGDLFASNRAWSERTQAEQPDFFERLAEQQAPRYLWIGCSDSRVPASQIVDLMPGELFVHRNVANVIVHTDLNSLSVLQYAVEALQVEHVIVCGHYGCGGVQAAYEDRKLGLIDNWLRHVQDVKHQHAGQLEAIEDEGERVRRLCELNVVEQVVNVARTTIVQDAWAHGQTLSVHGWIYGLADGRLRDLGVTVDDPQEIATRYETAIAAVEGTS